MWTAKTEPVTYVANNQKPRPFVTRNKNPVTHSQLTHGKLRGYQRPDVFVSHNAALTALGYLLCF